ncbi:transglutaminase domain-containing protein [Microvirga alba]|uniref:Transglutaminase domain-containing protein n=1 Tax=Microvirga alba TaxID=2791025 RepID=A0A931FP61_9HYPH|nr:transglutaminase domain-containing protein [Microvirga alba]MBF9234679.1 transglutaminase domain-containing protein [Microvirga alba]
MAVSSTLYQIVRYLSYKQAIPVAGLDQGNPDAGWGTTLIIAPGLYTVNGLTYDLRRQGLFALMAYDATPPSGPAPYMSAGYQLIADPNNLDLLAVARGIAEMVQYGYKDEGLAAADWLATARTRKLASRCGPLTENFAKPIFASLGVPHRICRLVTGETPTDFDDGHVLSEVFFNGRWRLFDFPNNLAYTATGYTSTDDLLSLTEVVDRGVLNCVFVPLAEQEIRAEDPTSGMPPVGIYGGMMLKTEEDTREWLRRVYQIPGIDTSDGKTHWYLPSAYSSRASYITGLGPNNIIETEAAWRALFYPGPYSTSTPVIRRQVGG